MTERLKWHRYAKSVNAKLGTSGLPYGDDDMRNLIVKTWLPAMVAKGWLSRKSANDPAKFGPGVALPSMIARVNAYAGRASVKG